MNKSAALPILVLLTFWSGCASSGPDSPLDPAVTELLARAKQDLAPDRRTVVFDVEATLRGKRLTLAGEVHDARLKEALVRFIAASSDYEIDERLAALPDPALGDRTHAVVSLSVANLRSKRGHANELGTQALLGTPLRVLKQEKGWYYVQTPDEYLCWTNDRIVRMDPAAYRAWLRKPKVIVTASFAVTRTAAREDAPIVSDVVAGGILARRGERGAFHQVEYPDGRTAFLRKADAAPYDAWLTTATDTPERIVATAKRFMGVPYLWGGTSPKGMDCSGYTKTVYFLNGVLLPRDASQQVHVGERVEPGAGMKNLRAGDLIFFGSPATDRKKERVWHVGISLGGPRFIHASGDVQTGSFSPGDPDYIGARARTFLRAKRIIGVGEASGVRRLTGVPSYNPNATSEQGGRS